MANCHQIHLRKLISIKIFRMHTDIDVRANTQWHSLYMTRSKLCHIQFRGGQQRHRMTDKSTVFSQLKNKYCNALSKKNYE